MWHHLYVYTFNLCRSYEMGCFYWMSFFLSGENVRKKIKWVFRPNSCRESHSREMKERDERKQYIYVVAKTKSQCKHWTAVFDVTSNLWKNGVNKIKQFLFIESQRSCSMHRKKDVSFHIECLLVERCSNKLGTYHKFAHMAEECFLFWSILQFSIT